MDAKTTALPEPRTKGAVSLEEAVQKRRSVRSFSARELDRPLISQLLWAAQGITSQKPLPGLRAAPSAGALYPLETYAVTKEGVFSYLPKEHALRKTLDGDLRGKLAGAALGQGSVSGAPLDIVLCAVYPRITGKYGRRGVRYAHMEAGHIAQNIHLQAAALGLGSVPIGAFDESGVAGALALPKDCEPVYIIPVGYPR